MVSRVWCLSRILMLLMFHRLSLQCAMEHVNRANVTVKVLKQRPLLLKGNHHLVSFSVT